jgi:hypothetical protein
VCVLNDEAFGGLAEDLCQPRDGNDAGGDQILQNLAGTDRWKLVDIADKDELGV